MEALTPNNIMDAENSDCQFFETELALCQTRLEEIVPELNELRRQNDRLREALRQCKGAIYGYASTNPLAVDSVLWKAHDAAVMALQNKPASGKGE